jgi:hypothetical protein
MAPTACADSGPSSNATMTITVKNPSCLQRAWPSTSVGVILLLVAGSILAYPIWALLLAKYVEERESLFGVPESDAFSIVAEILDTLAQGILEMAPSLVARTFTLYIGLCVGYVGIATLGWTLRNDHMSKRS